MQERIGFDFQYHQVTAAPDIHKLDVSHRGSGLAGGRLERAEILFTQKRLRGAMHGLRIEGASVPGHLPLQQRRANHSVGDNIAIATRQRREAGMEFGGNWNRPVNANGRWQGRIAAHHPRFAAARDGVVKMNDLGMGMDTGIGTTGTLHPKRRIGDPSQCLFELILHCDDTDMRLRLPAIVAATVVFDTARDPRTSGKRFS